MLLNVLAFHSMNFLIYNMGVKNVHYLVYINNTSKTYDEDG